AQEENGYLAGSEAGVGVVGLVHERAARPLGNARVRGEVDGARAQVDVEMRGLGEGIGHENGEAAVARASASPPAIEHDGVILAADRRAVLDGGLASLLAA